MDIHERPAWAINGWAGVVVVAACIAVGVLLAGSRRGSSPPIVIAVLVATSLVIVQPGQTKVVQFFGSYVGTVRRTGLWWVVPLADRRSLSIRVRNFETNQLKVNDADGNPVEIAAIVVWQVADTAKAVYAVDDYVDFVSVQAESALRHVATTSPLRRPRGRRAPRCAAPPTSSPTNWPTRSPSGSRSPGVEIVEVRISHLAYAPEIAQAMLRRQQANAVVAARSRIVEGAVGMVEMALDRLDEHGIVELDEERKAAMVSNLHGRALRRPAGLPGRQHRLALHVSRERKQVLLRLDPAVHDALARWATDELRSLNAQIEMLLRRALDRCGPDAPAREAGPQARTPATRNG